MRRTDWLIVAAGTSVGVVLAFFLDGLGNVILGEVVVVGTVASLVTLNHSLGRHPDLVVEYRNPQAGDGPFLHSSGEDARDRLDIYIVNHGKGSAEAIEVTFERNGWTVYNESGNKPHPLYLDASTHPPRFTSAGRVLGPDEEWRIARLAPPSELVGLPPPAKWEARAKGMAARRGEIHFEWFVRQHHE